MVYRKAKSLYGDKVMHIARIKKGGPVIARADSEEELDEMLAARDGSKVEKKPKKKAAKKLSKSKDGQKSSKVFDSLRSRKS